MAEPSRREALDLFLFTSIAATGVAALSPLPFFLAPPLSPAARASAGLRTSLGSGQGKSLIYGGRPAIVVRRGDEILAFDATCTHAGCPVEWSPEKKEFLCPCHKGRFGADGAPAGGPVRKPLARLPVALSPAGEIWVGE
jgi:Rieske Fe-S protein